MCLEFLHMSSTQSSRNSSRNPKRTKMQSVKAFFSSIRSGFVSKGKSMGIILGLFNPELSAFQKKKLLHEFHVFFDLNKDGILEWKDFDLARKKICDLSGWKVGTEKFQQTNELFITIWRRLQDEGDENNDGKISTDEWKLHDTHFGTEHSILYSKDHDTFLSLTNQRSWFEVRRLQHHQEIKAHGQHMLKMWEKFNEQCIKESKKEDAPPPERKLPEWLDQYIEYKFNLYDRTADGRVDAEEFEYVLSDFGVPPKDSRCAFLMFSCNNTKKVDLEYFKDLCIDYYRSDEPSALGNFITGKLDFND